jgi:hypothetical protein
MKEFTTAVAEVTEDQEAPMVFKIDGQELRAYKPTEGQLAMLMAQLGRHTSETTKVAGIIDFFTSVMDEKSHQYVVTRLLSRDDPMELKQVEEVMEWMVEEWSGRPTKSPNVSTR